MAGRSIEKALVGSALALALARSALGATDAGDWHGQILKDEIASAGALDNSLDRMEQVPERVAQHHFTDVIIYPPFSTDPGDGPTRLDRRIRQPQQQIIAPSDDNRNRRRQNDTRGSGD